MPLAWLEARSPEEERERLGAAGRALLAPLTVASWGYGLAARLHRGLYSAGLAHERRLPCRVVSVGSLLAGGTGKTPLAAWLAAGLRARGHRVALATRGYGRRRRDPVHALSDGRRVWGDVSGMGDEPLVLAGHAHGVPVLVGRDRGLVGLRAVGAFDTELLVLDDGFQHHRLHRDLDVVTFDGTRGFGNRRLLPRGPLREPPSALARAHAVAVLDGPMAEADEALLARHAVRPFRIRARREPVRLRPLGGGPSEPPTALAGLRVGLLAALGSPRSFEHGVGELGATVVARRFFPDHHRYRPADVRRLHEQAAVWITTEKDAVKLLPGWSRADIRVLRVELVVEESEAVLDWVESQLA